jgi:uncharacterized protein (DUF697 family)
MKTGGVETSIQEGEGQTGAAASGAAGLPVPKEETKEVLAAKIIRSYVMWSMGTALIPIPILDMAAVTAIQLKMLKKLCDHFEMRFSGERAKAMVASLIGGFQAGLFSGSLVKAIPFVGLTAAVVPIGVVSGALTYAIGKVFARHFESGGTLFNFDPGSITEHFAKQVQEGKKMAAKMRQ